ncbi:MAG: phosphatase, partial [Treponema sp.]|nr:phosphatase [Treponema sp.]
MRKKPKTEISGVKPEAIIEIASTGIRLSVVEILPGGQWNTLDRSDMPVNLGLDIFTGGSVKQNTISQCIQILSRYKEQIKAWGIEASDVSVIATAALRESRDKDSIIDRIFIRTGFVVRVIDGVEENRLM